MGDGAWGSDSRINYVFCRRNRGERIKFGRDDNEGKSNIVFWQHLLLMVSLYLMTLGVVLCVKSCLGSSVISSLPFVFSLAGPVSRVPEWTIGGYTIAMNFILVFCQVLILRKKFEPVQLFQLVIGFVFGWLIDLNMFLTSALECGTLPSQLFVQFAGCTIMGIGIAFEVRCGSVTMPGEGISIVISQVARRPFAKVKIGVDTALVVLAVGSCYFFFWALAMECHRHRDTFRDGLCRPRGEVHHSVSGVV